MCTSGEGMVAAKSCGCSKNSTIAPTKKISSTIYSKQLFILSDLNLRRINVFIFHVSPCARCAYDFHIASANNDKIGVLSGYMSRE